MSGSVTIEREGRITTVRIDRGDGVNALSDAVMVELTDVARSFESDAETSAVILTGSDSVFSLGFDLTDRSTAEVAALFSRQGHVRARHHQ